MDERASALIAELLSQLSFWTYVGLGFGWLSFILFAALVSLLRMFIEQHKEYKAALDFRRSFADEYAKYQDNKSGIPLETLYKASEN